MGQHDQNQAHMAEPRTVYANRLKFKDRNRSATPDIIFVQKNKLTKTRKRN